MQKCSKCGEEHLRICVVEDGKVFCCKCYNAKEEAKQRKAKEFKLKLP